MARAKKQFRCVVFIIIFTAIFAGPIFAKKTEWLILNNNIAGDVKHYNIKMRFVSGGSTFYETSSSDIDAVAVKEQKDYEYSIDFGKAIDQKRYSVLLNNADLKFIGRNNERLCKAMIMASADKAKPDILGEGYMFFGREFEMPIEILGSQLQLPTDEMVKGHILISIQNNDSRYFGSIRTRLEGVLEGSVSDGNGTLCVSVRCGNSVKTEDRVVNLSFRPYASKASSLSGSGAISGGINLGKAAVVVEKIASDNSEIVLAVVREELTANTVNAATNQDTLIEGKPFPVFSRVDLLQRRVVSLDDMKNKSGENGFVVLIFGNFKNATEYEGRGFHGGDMPGVSSLTLDETIITDTLSKEVNNPVTIGFVCNQISFSDFYGRWLGRDIDFYLLSDYSDPMKINFIASNPNFDHYMGGRIRQDTKDESLRGRLGLSNDKVVVALINSKGNLVYINTDAGVELSDTLLRINKLMKASQAGVK